MKLNLSSASWRMLLFIIMNTEQGIMNNEVLTHIHLQVVFFYFHPPVVGHVSVS